MSLNPRIDTYGCICCCVGVVSYFNLLDA